ncbi:MAG: DUF3887 domain-containing protein [Anaerolineaceae bacterium]|nr:DUF3887 domain-containing protein [Anaerolineaceae bacterium]
MKRNRILLFVLLFLVILSGCTSTKLAESYDENTVIERGKKVVELINTQDFDLVNAELRDDLEDQLTSDQLKGAMGQKLMDAGSFVEYQSVSTLGQKSKSTGEDYATVVLVGEYENGTLVFTVTMGSNLDLVGLYLK